MMIIIVIDVNYYDDRSLLSWLPLFTAVGEDYVVARLMMIRINDVNDGAWWSVLYMECTDDY